MKYIIEIEEVLQKQIQVVADTPEKAIEIAEEVYYGELEVLTGEDLKETTFKIIKKEKFNERKQVRNKTANSR